MTKDTLGDHAIVVFLQALAATMWNIEDLKPEERNRENVIRAFDGYLKETLKLAESEGLEVRENVEFLHKGLKHALDQMKLLKAPTGRPV